MSVSAATIFAGIGGRLRSLVEEAAPLLRGLSHTEVTARPQPDKWSKKEIIGHLIDSASNNHQRFTRAALAGSLAFPGYQQAELVPLENFQEFPWRELVAFWESYNHFLAHVISGLPASASAIQCAIGEHDPVTLEWLASDYVEHMKHHLNQVLGKRYESAWKL